MFHPPKRGFLLDERPRKSAIENTGGYGLSRERNDRRDIHQCAGFVNNRRAPDGVRGPRAPEIAIRIFGLKGLDTSITAETGAIPHFSRSLYDGVDLSMGEKGLRLVEAVFRGTPAGGSTRSEQRTWKALNETFERDLEALPGDVWRPDNLVGVVAIKPDSWADSLLARAVARPAFPRRLPIDASADLSAMGGGLDAWGTILPRRL
jgi:hypothetical protein